MTLPFHPASSHVLPSSLFDFLGNSDLAQLTAVNQIVYRQSNHLLQKRRDQFLHTLFSYFESIRTSEPENRIITLRKRYDKYYYPYVKSIFRCLPELFQYIQLHQINYLDFGCVNDYGGYPESAYRMISQDDHDVREIGYQVLGLLRENTTLYSCNLGLFEGILSRSEVYDTINGHPAITYISMRSNGSRTNFLHEPHTIWRNSDGTCYWAHFRNT